MMICPECNSNRVWRNEVDVGVGIYCDEWKCDECGWDENLGDPMTPEAWERFIDDGWECGIVNWFV